MSLPQLSWWMKTVRTPIPMGFWKLFLKSRNGGWLPPYWPIFPELSGIRSITWPPGTESVGLENPMRVVFLFRTRGSIVSSEITNYKDRVRLFGRVFASIIPPVPGNFQCFFKGFLFVITVDIYHAVRQKEDFFPYLFFFFSDFFLDLFLGKLFQKGTILCQVAKLI